MGLFDSCDRKKLISIGCTVLFIGVIVGLGIAELVIYVSGTKYTGKDEACPEFPKNVSNLSITIPILGNIFHDRIYFDKYDESWIQQTCPTVNYDSDLVFGGKLLSRTDTTFFSVTQEFAIKDCHGDNVYWLKTGSFEETLKNSFKVKVSMGLKNYNQSQDLGFIRGDNFFTDKYEIVDYETEKTVLYMEKSIFSFTWKIERRVLDHPGSDIRVISALIGKRNLSSNKDNCNGFFRGVAIFFLIIAIFLGIAIICIMVQLYRRFKASRSTETEGMPLQNIN